MEEADESDKERYNTVYAQDAGSVAAPTAGLNFTDDVLKEIGASNMSSLALHVGAGTFMPGKYLQFLFILLAHNLISLEVSTPMMMWVVHKS